ncbi:MAG: hypothetical protein ACTHWA_01310 [Arachnia sp.]
MWIEIVTVAAAFVAVVACGFAVWGWKKASAANAIAQAARDRALEATQQAKEAASQARDSTARAQEAITIFDEQRDTADANNVMVRDANSLATEALRLTRDEHERVQRREDESHEVNWGVTWDDRPPLDVPEHVIDRRLRVVQYGPDDAMGVKVLFYVGSFRVLTRDVGDMKCDAHLTLFPLQRERLIEEQLNRRWKDSAGNPVSMGPDSPSVVSAVEGAAYQAFNFSTKVIIRWNSPAGISHQKSYEFRPLSQRQLGADVRYPLP